MAQTKRPRTVQGKNTTTFHNPDHLVEALKSRNPETLKNALVSFRNQITVAHDERPSAGDSRVVLVVSWLEKYSAASELFDIWDTGSNYVSLVLVSLAHTLHLLSATASASTHASAILRVLFDTAHARRLNAHLASGQTDVVLATLKVLNAAALIDHRVTFESIAWTTKALPKLLSHRHRTPTSEPLVYPSIRTALTTLLLTLLPHSLSLELFTALFKGLSQDDGVMVKMILEACWEKVWGDSKVSKSLKVKVFGRLSMFIQPLYDRTEADSTDPLIPADIAHHFLLALCTRPGSGLCFHSKGWYPRPSGNPIEETIPTRQDDEREDEGKGGAIYNPLLLKLLRLLRPSVDARQYELAVRILDACPDLVAAYFAKGPAQIGLSLEPRLSTRWITSIGFVGSVIGAKVPVESFYLEAPAHSLSTRVYRAEPPPLNTIVENIVPNVLTRAWLTKALLTRSTLPTTEESTPSATGGLVQHTTIRILTRCLLKLLDILGSFPSGWAGCASEVVDAVRRRVPEVGVVIGIAQEATRSLGQIGTVDKETEGAGVRGLLLAEGSLRLLWLYARALPSAMAEVRFDVGKLLQDSETESWREGEQEAELGMKVMCQIHVLRLLGESDQFAWAAKPTGSPHTHMYRLLALHLHTPHMQLRDASAALVVRLLKSSVLFEHDPREAQAWIDSFPKYKHTTSRDEDDIAILLSFFDDVLLRCTKTPYKYLEVGNQLYGRSGNPIDIMHMPSPLLMAVLEQLRNKPMEPYTRRVVVAFVARLVRAMIGKMEVASARAIVDYMRGSLQKGDEESGGINLIKTLDTFLSDLVLETADGMDLDTVSPPEVTRLLDQLEAASIGDEDTAGTHSALSDLRRFRCFDGNIGAPEVSRIVKLMVSHSVDIFSLEEFLEGLNANALFMAVQELEKSGMSDVASSIMCFPLSFWLYSRHGFNLIVAKDLLHKSISRQLNEQLPWSCGLIAHRLSAANRASSNSDISSCLDALNIVVCRAVNTQELDEIKQKVLGDSEVMKDLMTQPNWSARFKETVSLLLSKNDEVDCALAAPYSQHWSNSTLEAGSAREFEENVAGLITWIPFTSDETCVKIFKTALERIEDWSSVSSTIQNLLEKLAEHFHLTGLDKKTSKQLAEILPWLIRVPASTQYNKLLKLASTIVERELPLGVDFIFHKPSDNLVCMIEQALARWSSKTGVPGSMSWNGFCAWIVTPELSRLSTALIYQSATARASFSSWIGEQTNIPARAMGPCFALMDCQAILEREPCGQLSLSTAAVDNILDCAARIFFKNGERTGTRRWATQTLINTVQALPTETDRVARAVMKHFPSNPREVVHQHIFTFALWAASQPSHFEELVDLVVDSSLLWLVRRFAEDQSDSPELMATLPGFETLLSHVSNTKPHLVEPVLIAAIKNRFDIPVVMQLCFKLVTHTPLKPASVNKLLQSIIHHSSFTPICGSRSPATDGIIDLLHSLFRKHPSSTCHPSHIIPLLSVYHGTLSRLDTQILSIFALFERSRQMSVLAILTNWTPDPSHAQPKDLLTTVCNFDPTLVFRTCTSFPQRRDPQVTELENQDSRDDLYDPNFALALLAALMVSDEPITSMQWVDLGRTNILALAISSLSSKQPLMRQLGYSSLVTAYTRLPDVDFQERAQLVYTLDLLRNLFPKPCLTPAGPILRLSTYTTLLLSHALRDIFSPATPIYPLISRFLLQRPEFDTADVPMLYTLLYSSTAEWKRERGWLLRFLSDGMRSTDDWKVLKRRHTWDLLASLFQSTPAERTLRLSILEVLTNASANKHAGTSLLLNSSILSWIQMQLSLILPGEGLAYLKIIENLTIVVDHEQIEQATVGYWRDTIAQVIYTLIQGYGSESGLLYLSSRILLRLTVTLRPAPASFIQPLRQILDSLRIFEPTILTANHLCDDTMSSTSDRLHMSRELLRPIEGNTFQHWTSSVRALWRVMMSMEKMDGYAWVNLNSRMLLLATMDTCGAQDIEWARRQVVGASVIL